MQSQEKESCDVGLIGLAVMGQNLVLNLADHGYRVAVYNRTTSVMQEFVEEHPPKSFGSTGGAVIGCETLQDMIAALKRPRVIIVLVKAGAPVDAVAKSLLEAGIEPDDILVDGGNSLWTDTIRRERDYKGKLTFFGSGVSGGETGARFGPSLMPGGDAQAWQRLKPIWESIAAKVDPDTGREIEGASPANPIKGGEPCTTYIGPNGAGHYVKMVHNGIEYADMQLICEAYDILRRGCGMSPAELSAVFEEWNKGPLDSFLIEITADILQQRDPMTENPLVDIILDRAGMKGTGTWTAINSLNLASPTPTIAEAVFARGMSAMKNERLRAAELLQGPQAECTIPRDELVSAVRDALYCSKVCAYAQGFELMRAAQVEYNWQLNFADIARIWRGGCIIRARLLHEITLAFTSDPALPNLLLDPAFRTQFRDMQHNWRKTISTAVTLGIPTPAFSSALAYFDSYRTATLPANLLQAQRDYFGAHTYERIDQPAGEFYHIDWPEPKRPQIKVHS